MKKYLRYLLTGVVVLIAVAALFFKYRDYVTNPWTRDGQVRAQVVQITPRVSARFAIPVIVLSSKLHAQITGAPPSVGFRHRH